MKGFKIIIVTCILFLLPSAILAVTSAELNREIEEVRREREALVEEQEKLQAELDKINLEAQSLGTAVKSLDTTRKKLAQDIKVTQSKINSTDLSIKQLENSMSTAEYRIVTHRQAIGNVLQVLFHYDERPLLLDFLASASFSDVWRDRVQLEELNLDLKDEVDDLRETKVILSKEKIEKEKAKKKIVSLQSELNGQKKVVEQNKSAKERLLAETKSKEAEYERLIRENIARQKETEADQYRLEQELRIVLDPSLFPDAKHGLLSWPLEKVYITGRFGRSDCSIYAGPDCFHNGTDFRASMGTPILSMGSGTVEGTGNTDEQKGCYSYGRWILVRHNNGLSSVYSHLSGSLVQKGQEVSAGQVIGYSGGIPGVYGSGYSKGPHLHVGLLASQGVEVRQFTTSTGCKKVSVPIAKGRDAYLDPLAYLPAI